MKMLSLLSQVQRCRAMLLFKNIYIFHYYTLENLAYFYSYGRYKTLIENLNLNLGSLVYLLYFAGIDKII